MAAQKLALWKGQETRGIPVSVENKRTRKTNRFCDLMSSHLMRKTAITNMLILGVEESLVRKISGHAAGSREFFRYVHYAQSFMDLKTDHYFEELGKRKIA